MFSELWNNRILICGAFAWLVAQGVKAVIYRIVNGNFSMERLFGDGGMPSGHSATVTAASFAALYRFGASSSEFAITALLAVIVMHDALGVRRETGKQAVVLTHLIEDLNNISQSNYSPPQKLKLLVGHTPIQVGTGFVIGVAVASFLCLTF